MSDASGSVTSGRSILGLHGCAGLKLIRFHNSWEYGWPKPAKVLNPNRC